MNCDFIASAYRYIEYARFGKLLERCRFAHCDRLDNARRVLVVGEGDGRFITHFAASNPLVTADVFDTSRKMLELTARRLRANGCECRIRLHNSDVRMAQLDGSSYDLAVTHFLFDVFSTEELRSLVHSVSASLKPRSQWLVSEFDVPERGLSRWTAQFWLRMMYLFFHCTTRLQNQQLPEWRTVLAEAGFRPRSRISFKRGFLVSEFWERRA